MNDSGLLGLSLATLIAAAPMVAHADVSSWCPEGQQAFSAGKYEAANQALNTCLYSPPEQPDIAAEGYIMRGETYLHAQDYEAALSDFERAIELLPANAVAWRSKAWVHYKRDELHPAVTAIGESLEIDPHNTESHHIHAQILTAMGREAAAMDAYDLAYSFESPATVQALQNALESQGFTVGAIDGVYGARTREALKECIAAGCNIPL